MSKYVVSANYIARDSKEYRWLCRPSNSTRIQDLYGHGSLALHDVKFETSTVEVGFGCSMVAVAENVNSHPRLAPEYKKLKFNGAYFVDAETDKEVKECKKLALFEDGSMYYLPVPEVCEACNRPL